MSKKHYELGPSGAPAWTRCSAKPNRERGIPNDGNAYSDVGTICHDLAERKQKNDEVPPVGSWARLDAFGDVNYMTMVSAADARPAAWPYVVTDEMMGWVNVYCDFVALIPGTHFVEVRVPIDHVTGEEGGSGTSDTIVLDGEELVVIDLKTGYNPVDAYDEGDEVIDLVTGEITRPRTPNYQAALYAAGALRKLPDLMRERGVRDWTQPSRVRIVIVQPSIDHISEFTLSVADLDAHMAYLRERAEATRDPLAPATPGEKQCRYCRARTTCPELQATVMAEAIAGFPDDVPAVPKARTVPVYDLNRAFALVPLIEDWCTAVRADMFRALNAGEQMRDWKLVEGRRGDRAWAPGTLAELDLIVALGDDAYAPRKVISPAQAEKKLKKTAPDAWAVLQAHITQPDGSPSVAPMSDPRPAMVVRGSDVFDDITTADEAPASVADIF